MRLADRRPAKALPDCTIAWRTPREIRKQGIYSQVIVGMAVVCKTVASTLPATADPPGSSRALPSRGTSCALEWLIWTPYVTLAPDSLQRRVGSSVSSPALG